MKRMGNKQVVSLERELGVKKIPERGSYHVEKVTEGDNFEYVIVDERGSHWDRIRAKLINGHYVCLSGDWGKIETVVDREKISEVDKFMKSYAKHLLEIHDGRPTAWEQALPPE
jgi:hypothetical protein